MKRPLVLGTLVVAGALSAGVSAGVAAMQQAGRGGPPPPMVVEVQKLKDNFYVLRGGGGNTAALIGAEGVTLVDTKLPGWGKPLLDKVRELTDKPVTTIINTHTHFDHVSGNVEFPATVNVVTHENTARLMNEANPVTGLQTGPQQNIFKENGGRGLAKQTFKSKMTLGKGDERIDLYYFGRAHTGGDTFVVFPALRILHTGDAFPNKGVPIMDANNGGSGVEYPKTIAKAAKLKNIDIVITGHSPNMTMADLEEYGEFNGEFVKAVQAAKKAGKTVDEVVATWKVPERFKGYPQPMPNRLKPNVEVVWNETK
jgi:glyoxylase-like metal-dependent hydrolase (beta-lactamase superfamily II)